MEKRWKSVSQSRLLPQSLVDGRTVHVRGSSSMPVHLVLCGSFLPGSLCKWLGWGGDTSWIPPAWGFLKTLQLSSSLFRAVLGFPPLVSQRGSHSALLVLDAKVQDESYKF